MRTRSLPLPNAVKAAGGAKTARDLVERDGTTEEGDNKII